MSKYILFSDIDNTLFQGLVAPYNTRGLIELGEFLMENQIPFVTVSGRNHHQLEELMAKFDDFILPSYHIGSVGTEIHEFMEEAESGSGYKKTLLIPYEKFLRSIPFDVSHIENVVFEYFGSDLYLQPDSNQSSFKLSYYFDLLDLEQRYREELNVIFGHYTQVVVSTNHKEGKGFVDFLPKGVSKLTAIRFLLKNIWGNCTPIFAGDSGNDLEAMKLIPNSILVGNASDSMKSLVSLLPWVYQAQNHYSEGVLEGLRHFTGLQ